MVADMVGHRGLRSPWLCWLLLADPPSSSSDAKEASLLSTSVILEECSCNLELEVNACTRYSTWELAVVVVVVAVADDSFVGFFFDRFAGRLTLSLWLTQVKPLDSHNSNSRHRL